MWKGVVYVDNAEPGGLNRVSEEEGGSFCFLKKRHEVSSRERRCWRRVDNLWCVSLCKIRMRIFTEYKRKI